MEKQEPICPRCQTGIPGDAPGGLCPICVIGLGLSDRPAGMDDPTEDKIRSSDPGVAFVAPSAEDLDQLFEHLEVESLLGQGGMGAVYKARQISLDRQVALKILPPYSGADPSFQERFQREARALARLTHPNIVMVFEFGQVSGMFYFVMEYVDGVNLREAMIAGGLTTRESMEVIPQICEALQFAHDEGIVHRDVKPENIMLDSRGRVKITDFGLAKLLERNAVNFTLTSTNQVLGTVKYMAPEQIENPNTVDHRSDIYSLGVVFYELLTGELPLGRFDPPSAVQANNLPLDPVVMRTLAKQPANRFQQASQIKSAVESIVLEKPASPEKERKPSQKPEMVEGKEPIGRSSAGRLPVVNFILQDVYAGFGSGKGLLRLDLEQEQLLLDIEIKGPLGGILRPRYEQLRIGFHNLLAQKRRDSWLVSPRVELQTDCFEEMAGVPGTENGKITLKFAFKDREKALQIFDQIEERLDIPTEMETGQDVEVALEASSREIDKPASGLFVAGVIDLGAALVGMLLAILFFFEGGYRERSLGMILPLWSLGFACLGIFQIYLCYTLKSLQKYWVSVIGCLLVSLFFVHPGALFGIPSAIWCFGLMVRSGFRKAFLQSESYQEILPERRTLVFASQDQRVELRFHLSSSIRALYASGFLSAVICLASFLAIVTTTGPTDRIGEELAILYLLFYSSTFGSLLFVGAVILQISPSLFWARTASWVCQLPVSLFYPFNFWIGRKIRQKVKLLESMKPLGNPYEDKDEVYKNQ